jgi:hypothetical protein
MRTSRKHTGPNYKLRGENNAMFTPGVKEKRREIFFKKYGAEGPSLVPWKCPHCEREGKGLGTYSRFHGDNCHLIKPRKIFTCDYCGIVCTNISNFNRYHGENRKCKLS